MRRVRAIEVVAPGPSALIQDLGRPGHAHLGVPPSGAVDEPALRLGNRLVGNPEPAAGIEALLGGVRVCALTSCTVAVTGPPVSVTVHGRTVGSHAPLHLARGDTLRVGTPATGVRSYLAFSGGIELPTELGSRSCDTLSGIGPPALREGDVLGLGASTGLPAGVDTVAFASYPNELTVPVWLGPRGDWFTEPDAQLADGVWTVTTRSDRVGLRLDGPVLRRTPERAHGELPSEAIRTGAIQVPPDGLPVLFLADHPTTGGYPVIGVVSADALPALGQARPGTRLRFRLAHHR